MNCQVLYTSGMAAYLAGSCCFVASGRAQEASRRQPIANNFADQAEGVRAQIKLLGHTVDRHDFSRMAELLRSLQDHDEDITPEQRDLSTRLMLRAIAAMSMRIDPAWNAKDMPTQYATPPPGSTISVGADPSAIKDPVLQATYKKAIADNAEKLNAYQMQINLRGIKKQLMSDLFVFIRSHFVAGAKDREMAEAIIEEELKSKDERQQIKDAFQELDSKFFIAPSGVMIRRPQSPKESKARDKINVK